MVIVAQLVRASDCGSEGRGFETRLSPRNTKLQGNLRLFLWHQSMLLFGISQLDTMKSKNILVN